MSDASAKVRSIRFEVESSGLVMVVTSDLGPEVMVERTPLGALPTDQVLQSLRQAVTYVEQQQKKLDAA